MSSRLRKTIPMPLSFRVGQSERNVAGDGHRHAVRRSAVGSCAVIRRGRPHVAATLQPPVESVVFVSTNSFYGVKSTCWSGRVCAEAEADTIAAPIENATAIFRIRPAPL